VGPTTCAPPLIIFSRNTYAGTKEPHPAYFFPLRSSVFERWQRCVDQRGKWLNVLQTNQFIFVSMSMPDQGPLRFPLRAADIHNSRSMSCLQCGPTSARETRRSLSMDDQGREILLLCLFSFSRFLSHLIWLKLADSGLRLTKMTPKGNSDGLRLNSLPIRGVYVHLVQLGRRLGIGLVPCVGFNALSQETASPTRQSGTETPWCSA